MKTFQNIRKILKNWYKFFYCIIKTIYIVGGIFSDVYIYIYIL
jgi:hypothetical protein